MLAQLRRGHGANGPGTDAYVVMQRAALALEQRMNGEAEEDEISIEIRLGDMPQTMQLMIDLRRIIEQCRDDEPETARLIEEAVDRWNMTK